MGKSETVNVVVVTVPMQSTDLTIELSRSSGFPGTIQIYGELYVAGTAGVIQGATIDLYVTGQKVASTITGSGTIDGGKYSFNYTVEAKGYDFYTYYAGSSLYNPDSSPPVQGTYAKVGTTFYGLDVNPTYGEVPLAVQIIAQLRRDDTGLGLSGKTVELWRNNVKIKSMTSVTTSGGPGFVIFNDTLTAIGSYGYYLYFAGDSQFEGCEVLDGSVAADGEPPVDGLGGAGALLLLLLVLSQE